MDRHPLSQRYHDLLGEIGELHDKKQSDYGRADDPFANVRASSDWGVPGWIGAMIRLTDKVKRLQALAIKGELANESASDSFMDIAVYSLIAQVLYEEAIEVSTEDEALEMASVAASIGEDWIQFITFGLDNASRFTTPTSTKQRAPIDFLEMALPDEFPLKWHDQLDELSRAIHREQARSWRPPEHIFLPERRDGDKARFPSGLTIFGIPVGIDASLDPGEFVLRSYNASSHVVEYRHYMFSEGSA